MANIKNYYDKKQLMEKLSQELKSLEQDSALQKDLEFEGKIRDLIKKYGKEPRDVLKILSVIDPTIGESGEVNLKRKPRAMKVYKNPHTGEVVKTKGGNHKTLKAWREKYGAEEVDKWKE